MNSMVEQIFNIYKAMPRSRKIIMGVVLLLVISGFAGMFFWANKVDFQTLYTNLSPEEAAEIVDKLKEQRIPYDLAGNGSTIRVPAEKMYDVRLTLAGSGVPRGGTVGYEIFEETNFGASEFVQKLNYRRALQGELARTIREFREVLDARVMIVMPKESVFVEESKPSSASVLLKLSSNFSQEKITAVVNLVASAVEGLSPDRVTVVDTNGKVLSKCVSDDEKIGAQAGTQFDYKTAYEQSLARRIQTMLERIVGDGKAIVRVIADMDFDQVDINEEIYDPDTQVIRSRQNIVENSDRKSAPAGSVSSVNPIVPAGVSGTARETSDTNQRKNEMINYEISKTIRRTVKPSARVKRLSVAAVLDGNYAFETDEKGNQVRKYMARSQSELDQFATIVKKAMGYDADREDQVTVESFPFSYMEDMNLSEPSGFNWKVFAKEYGKILAYTLLIILIFIFIVLPVRKTVTEIIALPEPHPLSSPKRGKELPAPVERGALPEPDEMSAREKASYLAKQDIEKTANHIRGWLNEAT
jgi:flagellar M-ring protein FliF